MRFDKIEIFPTLVWKTNLKIDNNKIVDYCEEVEKSIPSVSNSNLGGYQSPGSVIREKQLMSLRTIAESHAAEIFNELNVLPHFKPYLQGGWISINRKGHMNHLHDHPQSFLAGVYYPKVPENSGSITFHDPRNVKLYVDVEEMFKTITPDNCSTVVMHPSDGDLIFFPSWLQHHVDASETDEPRISIAMNFGYHDVR